MSEKKDSLQAFVNVNGSHIKNYDLEYIYEWINHNLNKNDRKRFELMLIECIEEIRGTAISKWDKLSLRTKKKKAEKIERAVKTIIRELEDFPKIFKVCDYVQMANFLNNGEIRKSIDNELKNLKEYRNQSKFSIYIGKEKLSGEPKNVTEENLQDVLERFVLDINDFVKKKPYKRPNTGEPVIRYAIRFFADFMKEMILGLNNVKDYPNKLISSCVCLAFPDLSNGVDEFYVENILRKIR